MSNKWGYKEVYNGNLNRPNGCELEHRLVASNMLGRDLTNKEVVHHIDEDKSNNKPENLMIFKTDKDHLRYHWTNKAELLSDGTYISPVIKNNSVRKEDGSCETYCIDCGKEVFRESKRCFDCDSINKRTIERPTKEILIQDIESLGYCGTGRKYGVSDNAIRKWLKKY